MLIKGNTRGGKGWADYLLKSDNDRAEVLDIRGVVFDDDLDFAIAEMSISGKHSKKPFMACSINPAIGEDKTMTPEQWLRSIDILEQELGLTGQPRFAVLHEKKGRTHVHVGWERYDRDAGALRTDSNMRHKIVKAKGMMEIEFGHKRTKDYDSYDWVDKAQGRMAQQIDDQRKQGRMDKVAEQFADNRNEAIMETAIERMLRRQQERKQDRDRGLSL